MIANRGAVLLAAFAAILSAAPVTAKKRPAQPVTVVTDARLYQNAMECKVRLEALAAAIGEAPDRKRVEQALALWVAQEQAIAAKLGKSEGEVLKDEIFFGLEEGSRPGGLQRATICLEHAAAASRGR